MADNELVERDNIEQAIAALKNGARLLKYGRKGKPKLCSLILSNDEKALIWYSGKEQKQLRLNAVSRIIVRHHIAKFRQFPKEYQLLSLIYGNDEHSLDLVCKDKQEAELWFVGLKALASTKRDIEGPKTKQWWRTITKGGR
ncbi:hypothetical protein O6H91_19G061000 [Diphasiastrum complanatum]|uniref:Uncharacterized protein n=1 Tax=Diphasiastrum complanatum TaxID=34168 RepID=A0ACC2AVN5_DIPCM|nr:hypothetical protein O6H91_19G061000 [Diphasiastrum complanatum]